MAVLTKARKIPRKHSFMSVDVELVKDVTWCGIEQVNFRAYNEHFFNRKRPLGDATLSRINEPIEMFYLNQLSVLSNFKNHGISSQLIEAINCYLTSNSAIGILQNTIEAMNVGDSRVGAVKGLYERHGWCPIIGADKDYLGFNFPATFIPGDIEKVLDFWIG